MSYASYILTHMIAMSSPNTSASSPGCETASAAKLTLSFPEPTSLTSDKISVTALSTKLSEEAMARLGSVSDESDALAHSASPADLTGSQVLVFWGDEPTLYSAEPSSSSGCIISPAPSGATFSATKTQVLIDPRGIPSSRIDFSTGVISPDSTAEATDGTSKSGRTKTSGTISHSAAAGGKGSGGGKGGGEKTPRKGKGGKGGDGGDGGAGGNGSLPPRDYDVVLSAGPEMLVELPQMPIGIMEFFTFLPNHTQWPTWLLRAYRNGWSTGAIAKAQLHARGALTRAEWTRRSNALRHQIRTAVRNKYGKTTASAMSQSGHAHFQPFAQHSSGNNLDHYDVRVPVDDTGDVYEPPRGQNTLPVPATLQDLVNGVVNWPTGADAGQLTQALRYAQANGLLNQTTRDLPNIVLAQNFAPVAEASRTDWDLSAVERLNNAVAYP